MVSYNECWVEISKNTTFLREINLNIKIAHIITVNMYIKYLSQMNRFVLNLTPNIKRSKKCFFFNILVLPSMNHQLQYAY